MEPELDRADEQDRRDATATPDTVAAVAAVPSVRITIRQHGWSVWAQIAIRHEANARHARETDPTTEHLSGLVAIAAAAFALDALYGVARSLIPVPELDDPEETGEELEGKRARHVADRLRRGVTPGALAKSWPRQIRELYKTRNDAVHFGEQDSDPVWHPGLQSHASRESFAWRLEAAENAVDLMLEVLTAWAEHPSEQVRGWADRFGPAVASLVGDRGQDAD